jgi:hypothetical protein
MSGRNVRFGELVRVDSEAGYYLIQYIARHSSYGDMVAVYVRRRVPNADPGNTPFVGREVTFYPVRSAVRAGLGVPIGIRAPFIVPSKFRRAGARSNDGKILNWVIEETGRDTPRSRLSDNESALPVAQVLSHDVLLRYLDMGWPW